MKLLSMLYFVSLLGLCSAGCCGGGVEDSEALDISKPDSSKVDVEEETSNGIRWKVITPKGNADFKSFTEGRVDVGTTTEKFKYAKFPLDSPTLVEIAHGLHVKHLEFFEKVGESWNKITRDVFDKKLKDINDAVKLETTPEAKQEKQSANAEGTSDNLEDE